MTQPDLSAHLGDYGGAVESALAEMAHRDIPRRIWQKDHTVWKPEPAEIANRLDWLVIADQVRVNIRDMIRELRAVRDAGYRRVLLLGMGGSSLAPELFGRIFGGKAGLSLAVLDSTDPGAVLSALEAHDPRKTLYIVSSKSGTTVEMLSFFKTFYNQVAEKVGRRRAGDHFMAITDRGSYLAGLGEQIGFRATFLNNPHIGGRYSALSFFGIVPAVLAGADVPMLLDRAAAMAAACGPDVPAPDNPGAWLGAALGVLARAGRDKLTLILPPGIESFGDWAEQLIAESTGKEGVGILPVVGEAPGEPGVYGPDRVFVRIQLGGDRADEEAIAALQAAGHPVIRIRLDDAYDLGGQFFLWEMATAVASHLLGINPFDQPDVESAKKRATAMVAAYQQTGQFPAGDPTPPDGAALAALIAGLEPGGYLAIQAFLKPDLLTSVRLQELRHAIRDAARLAVTVGYGPRYLHSTGQLHKGDAGRGRFLLLTADHPRDLPIPDEAGSDRSSMTYGVLALAQALGDRDALEAAGRRVLHVHLGSDIPGGLERLAAGLG